jgi:hypothetical protein
MKNIITKGTVSNLPIANIGSVVTTILNHSRVMKQIETEYQYASQKMQEEYAYRTRELKSNLKAFTILANEHSKKIKYAHRERMQILEIVSTLLPQISQCGDATTKQILGDSIKQLLDNHSESLRDNTALLPSNQPNLLGRA